MIGTILFLVLKAIRDLHSPLDSYFFCLLIAIETPLWCLVWLSAVRTWVYVRTR